MSNNIITQIQTQYDFFTSVEKRIADLILKNPSEFITYSTAKVAKLCNVSQGSINNFSAKFTNAGFSFLKLEISRCISLENNFEVNLIEEKGIYHFSMQRKIRQDISALCNTLEINSNENLKKAVNLISSANKIELFGVYHSDLVAKSLYFKLIELKRNCSFTDELSIYPTCAGLLTDKDLVIAISISGKTKQIVDAVEIAKENGAKVISITGNQFSPLANLSDVVLLTTAGHGKSDGVTERMRMSQFLIIDTLCGYIELYK